MKKVIYRPDVLKVGVTGVPLAANSTALRKYAVTYTRTTAHLLDDTRPT